MYATDPTDRTADTRQVSLLRYFCWLAQTLVSILCSGGETPQNQGTPRNSAPARPSRRYSHWRNRHMFGPHGSSFGNSPTTLAMLDIPTMQSSSLSSAEVCSVCCFCTLAAVAAMAAVAPVAAEPALEAWEAALLVCWRGGRACSPCASAVFAGSSLMEKSDAPRFKEAETFAGASGLAWDPGSSHPSAHVLAEMPKSGGMATAVHARTSPRKRARARARAARKRLRLAR